MEQPVSGVAEAADGTLYGVSRTGPTDRIYQLAKGLLRTVHTLTPEEGFFAGSSLVLGPDGSLYGTTNNLYGTSNQPRVTPLGGTVFRIDPSGVFSTLHRFESAIPSGVLLQATDGNLYGAVSSSERLESSIFRLTPARDLTTLRTFASPTEGIPNSLVWGSDGYLYGITATGGGGFSGTVFGLSRTGGFAVLHEFRTARTDEGAGPVGLTQGPDGSLYGVTSGVRIPGVLGNPLGLNLDKGTVFKLAPGRRFTTLHRFTYETPVHGLVGGADGHLYGTTGAGIFRISLDGKLTTVHDMIEGGGSFLPLTSGRDGHIYGARSGTGFIPAVIFRVLTKP
jgi:hypothetical protein